MDVKLKTDFNFFWNTETDFFMSLRILSGIVWILLRQKIIVETNKITETGRTLFMDGHSKGAVTRERIYSEQERENWGLNLDSKMHSTQVDNEIGTIPI